MTTDQKRMSLVLRQFVVLPRDLQIKVLAKAANAYAARIQIESRLTRKATQ